MKFLFFILLSVLTVEAVQPFYGLYSNLNAGRRYIAATASAGANESDFSNVTNFTIPNSITLKLMGSPTLDFSNETEFFRLEIGK